MSTEREAWARDLYAKRRALYAELAKLPSIREMADVCGVSERCLWSMLAGLTYKEPAKRATTEELLAELGV